jgi:HSP20 family molecular chaperone IbpA
MNARNEMLRSLMEDTTPGAFEKRMEEIMKTFGGSSDFGFGPGFDSSSSSSEEVVGDYNWIDNKDYKILKLKFKPVKDRPLDIKIEKGEIRLKGDFEISDTRGKVKSLKKVHYERTFNIPTDVDQKNPEFENINGEMHIKFKKINQSKVKKPVPSKEDKILLTPDKNDLSI